MHIHSWVLLNAADQARSAALQVVNRTRPFGCDDAQVGGRFSGALADRYEPRADPRNLEPCPNACDGSNACLAWLGTRRRIKWPTEWVPFDGDVAPVADVLARIHWVDLPHSVLDEGGVAIQVDRRDGGGQTPEPLWRLTTARELRESTSGLVVVVDLHV